MSPDINYHVITTKFYIIALWVPSLKRKEWELIRGWLLASSHFTSRLKITQHSMTKSPNSMQYSLWHVSIHLLYVYRDKSFPVLLQIMVQYILPFLSWYCYGVISSTNYNNLYVLGVIRCNFRSPPAALEKNFCSEAGNDSISVCLYKREKIESQMSMVRQGSCDLLLLVIKNLCGSLCLYTECLDLNNYRNTSPPTKVSGFNLKVLEPQYP